MQTARRLAVRASLQVNPERLGLSTALRGEPNGPRRSMQCKDIPDRPIFDAIAEHQRVNPNSLGLTLWSTNLAAAFPPDCPEKLKRAKMGQLIKRGLVSGCTCGCRGDFAITALGRAFIAAN